MINQVKHILPLDSLRTLYFAMIQPHICYLIMAWANCNCAERGKILKLQKKAIRSINLANYNAHTDPLFKKSKILKIKDQLTYESSLFMYDYVNNILPHSFNKMFMTNQERNPYIQPRNSDMLYIPRCDTNFSRNLPTSHLPQTWNHYLQYHPNRHTICTSRRSFKQSLKKEMLEQYHSVVVCMNPRCRDCNT